MTVPRVKIQPEILHWVLRQTDEEKLGNKLMNNVIQWLDGTKTPTFHQVEELSKKSNIPLGYFFLVVPPVEQLNLLEYRTIDNKVLLNPSRNLIDTIQEMERVQDWMKEYRKDLEYDELAFVGSMRRVADIHLIVEKMRNDMQLRHTWYDECRNIHESFHYIRNIAEKCGIVVMMNGVVGKNTHRTLDANEFRAFAMVDSWAPLIFINTADSDGAKIFSLFHELAHIWIGVNDFFNDRKYQMEGVNHLEVICNAVAAELMVPEKVFAHEWNAIKDDSEPTTMITLLAKYFHCGECVIARRALDQEWITHELYDQVVQRAIDQYIENKMNKEPGGDYYNTMGCRLDGNLVRALCESIQIGRTTYSEAYRLTNTSRKTFDKVAKGFGGVLW